MPTDNPQTIEEAMRYYNDTIDNLTGIIAMREAEIKTLKARLQDFAVSPVGKEAARTTPLLSPGNEPDLYPGEAREILLDCLLEYIKQIPEGTRRRDVIAALLAANKAKGIPKQKAKLLKDALRGFTGLTSAIKQKLNEAGFDVSEKPNKHFRLTYYGDERYKATMACSGGDKLRGGKNLAAELIQAVL